jgi:formylglycine-generating enzyme required for sulfatase activity
MPPDLPRPQEETGLVVQRPAGLVTLPNGGSPALSEMICRSLAHLQTSKALAVPERRPGEECEFEIAPGVMMRMCWIPPGEFLMGSPEDELGRWGGEDLEDGETQHQVTITQGFWMGKYVVTNAQWHAVMGSNPRYSNGANRPVRGVSWNEISGPGGFLEKANRFAGARERFSLPTEAQWEYACRAGTTTALNSGKNLTSREGACPHLDEVAWYFENSGGNIHPGGLKMVNSWGLHDMHGNLYEWCSDWYGDYPIGPVADPRGPDSGTSRVSRGGAWGTYAGGCRAAGRSADKPSLSNCLSIGFRITRSLVPYLF